MDSRHVSELHSKCPQFPRAVLKQKRKGKTPMSHLTNRQKAETMLIGHTDRTVFPGVVYASVHAKDKTRYILKIYYWTKKEAYKNVEKGCKRPQNKIKKKELNSFIHVIERNRRQKNHSCGEMTKINISSNITIFIIVFSCQNSSVQRRRSISATAADQRVVPVQRTVTLPVNKKKIKDTKELYKTDQRWLLSLVPVLGFVTPGVLRCVMFSL